MSAREPHEYFGDGYCDCCRQFHLLKHHEVPALDQTVSICRYCADLGDLEIAWRIGGICEDGSYGYEHAPDRMKRPGRRMRRDPLAEALMLDDPGPIEIGGFRTSRLSPVKRARIAYWRLRGWHD